MRLEKGQAAACPNDPRRALCETKFFTLRPQPLEEYLYRLGLSQIQERVFWLHWSVGYRNGDFTSEMAISEVACRVHCNPSSVTRAYRALTRKGLLRRTDPGRDPSQPFNQAILVTEVLLPREVVPELLSTPNRSLSCASRTPPDATTEKVVGSHAGPSSAPAEKLPEPKPALDAAAIWTSCLETLRSEIPERDFKMWLTAFQPYARGSDFMLFVPNSFAIDWVRQHAQARIEQLVRAQAPVTAIRFEVGCRPSGEAAAQPSIPVTAAKPSQPRHIPTFALARLRRQLVDLKVGAMLEELLVEIVWSVERGALVRFEIPKAINIALKKVREHEWTRPNRMPSKWRRAVA